MPTATYWSDFQKAARDILRRDLSEEERGRFEKYLALLVEWNRVHRLIGSSDPGWIVEHVFLDSLLFLRALPHDVGALADVGSGAGIPGLPIKIVRFSLRITLIEARQHRISFLKTVIRELRLSGASLVEGRVEEIPENLLGTFDAAVARCAGPSDQVFEWATPLVKPRGLVVIGGPERVRSVPGLVKVQGWRRGQSRHFLVQRRS